MMEHVVSTRTIEQLNALTRTGLEPDTWTGARLQQALEGTRLILLLDIPRQEVWRQGRVASVISARREVWFVTKQMTVQHEQRLCPSLFANPTSLEPTTWGALEAGVEWYGATKYWIGREGRFANCGYGQLPVATLSAWMSNSLVDITADFDEALSFLGA